MSVPTITAAPTSFGSSTWAFRAPDLVPLLAQCYIEGGFRRRVVLDPDSGIVSLSSTASLHGFHAGKTSDAMDRFLDDRRLANAPLGASRWRHPDDPPHTGVEADASYYVGDHASKFNAACADRGEEVIDEYCAHHPPQLVIEVGATPGLDTLPLYRRRGIAEAWRLENTDPEGRVTLVARFWDLLGNGGITELAASRVLPGITPETFAAAVAATPSGGRPA